MSDWDTFREEASWAVPEGAAKEGEERSPGSLATSARFRQLFPRFAKLLSLARATTLRTIDQRYVLVGWTGVEGKSCGWLCPMPSREPRQDLYPEHRELLKEFGGIRERWGEPEDTLLANLNWALTEEDSGSGAEGWYDYYSERCQDLGVVPALNPEGYLTFALEANGNAAFYHRERGDVILFAPDHNFDYVAPLENAPEYTLYRIKGCLTFRDWVEAVADQWLSHVRV